MVIQRIKSFERTVFEKILSPIKDLSLTKRNFSAIAVSLSPDFHGSF
ncbi:hypothetical protein M595_1133 [Lyngbya aestuarii BL J]|uniref:Uncharacterized protein n=1 Tax=Lyngbya aestuarii BL J TaxID=1348334 RepID=U7QLP7_9CYAN|nr:hypothetical protein M595_1133 [Lyngbya aestuarii BL J]